MISALSGRRVGGAFVLAVYTDRPTVDAVEVDAAIAEIGELAASYITERNID